METLFAYLAGAIDIDGRIFIARAQGYRRRLDGRQVPYYIATIALSDSSPIVPDLLQATFPARRLQYDAKNRKQVAWHMWEAVNQGAHEPVARLLPYLRVKRRQAELALTLINLIEREKAGSARPLSTEQEKARALLYEEVLILNESRPNRTYR
jgi:hypothetical protein